MLFTILRPKCLIQREAKKGSGDNVPRLGDWGMKSPNVSHREAIKEKQSGSEALPDGESVKARIDLLIVYHITG